MAPGSWLATLTYRVHPKEGSEVGGRRLTVDQGPLPCVLGGSAAWREWRGEVGRDKRPGDWSLPQDLYLEGYPPPAKSTSTGIMVL